MHVRRQSNGEVLDLSQCKTRRAGGEGRIVGTPLGDAAVAKLYHHPTPAQAKKLAAMLENPCPLQDAAGRPFLAWPTDLLHAADTGRFAGFLMPWIAGARPVADLYHPRTRRQVCPDFSYRYLHRAARNLAALVLTVHSRGYVIGDVNESNALVFPDARVAFVDCDSFQVRDARTGELFRCAVGKGDHTPPELQGKNLRDADRTPAQDSFGLGVIVFRLLSEGTHPFDGQWTGASDPPSLEARIGAGHFPHGRRRVPWVPKPAAPPFTVLDPDLQRLFIRCFEDGHADPLARPDPAAWMDALSEAEAALIECQRNPNHVYGRHLRACPWCERMARLRGLDSFPAPARAAARRARSAGRGPFLMDDAPANPPPLPAAPPAAKRPQPSPLRGVNGANLWGCFLILFVAALITLILEALDRKSE